MDRRKILEFVDACVQADVDANACRSLSFSVLAGEAVFLETGSSGDGTLLCDAAEGLLLPARGRIMFLGQSWDQCSPARVSALRAKIGRVFCAAPWISNLSIYDNIVLAARHHTRMKEAAIRTAVDRLVKACGIDGVPLGRANSVPAVVLQRLQWVRAFLGQPELVLLEQPVEGLSAADAEPLGEIIRHARSEGTAVLWAASAYVPNPIIPFTKRYALRNGKLLPLMEETSE